ncbi:MAG: tyrosine-type recombinase/integrase [Patescibacteria group bacterium]|jgi:integrase/recombinase XerD
MTDLPNGYRGKGELWDLKDKYLCWMIASNYSKLTVRGAHADLSWFMRYLDAQGVTRIANITPAILEEYSLSVREPKNGIAPRPGYISHKLITIKQFFKYLTARAIILRDPAEDLEMPKLPQNLPYTILTQDEVMRLLNAPNLISPVGYRDKALLELLYASGIRTSEILKLKVADVDLKDNLVMVHEGKGRKDRIVPVPHRPMRYVAEYIGKIRPRFAKGMVKDDGRLFLSWTGAKLDINRLGEIIRRSAKTAGIEKRVTAMTFRHSIASHLLENGMGIRHIQEILGHEKLSTTQVYAKVTLTGLRKYYNRFHPKERRSQSSSQ